MNTFKNTILRLFVLLTILFSGNLWANTPPSATWIYPTTGMAYYPSTPIEFYVAANDPDGSVSKVEVYNGSTLMATVPSGYAFSDPNYGMIYYYYFYPGEGNFNFYAKVTDNLGGVTNTTPVNIIVAANIIDLAVNSFSSATTSIPASGHFTIDNTEINFGNTNAPNSHSVKFYLSTDKTYQSGDIQIGSRTVAGLNAGASSTESTSVTVPAYTPVGNYYVIVRADANNEQPETIETNNEIVSTGTLSVTSALPSAPTMGTATAGNAQATVNFTPPNYVGGTSIIDYTVTSSPSGISKTGTASPINITGLTNGIAYTFTVKARNVFGSSAASAASNSVTPSGTTVPSAPTIGIASAGNALAVVNFSAPTSTGGSAITGYTVTSSPGGIIKTGTTSPITVTGLTNGTAYSFTVTATNAIGTGAASAASNSVTPNTTYTVPAAPTIGSATAGAGQATVNFTAPTNNGGSTIMNYTVTSSPGGITKVGTVSPITMTGLTNGTAYTFTVKATNAVGTGAVSAASNSVTPLSVPGAPSNALATAGNAQASISFTAPNNGGSAITSYTVTASSGGISKTGTTSPIVLTGLTNGTAYTFTVKATNAVGTGAASVASNSIIPAATGSVPGAPTIGTATSGNTQAAVSFAAPTNTGGYAISSYTVTSTPGNFSASGVASPITVSGLANGTAYTFKVIAFNSMGPSVASVASNSIVPSTVPGAPTIGTAVADNTQATVNFLAPSSNGGAAISSYTVTATHSAGTLTKTTTASPFIFTGLTNGTAYTFNVAATNVKGTGAASAASNSVTPASSAGAQTYYIHPDHLNTPRMITDTAGNKRWEWLNIDPYGNNAASENPASLGAFTFNLRFPGQYYDKETGLHYNWFRTYDPATGRYVESDPIGLNGGLNTFLYVYGNPLWYVDSIGLGATGAAVGGVAGGYIGGAAGALVGPEGIPIGAAIGRAVGRVAGSELEDLCRNNNNDECRELENEMRAVAQIINGRAEDMLIDKCKQFSGARYKPNPKFFVDPKNTCGGDTTWVGHQRAMEEQQNRLKKLINKALKKGCQVPTEAWKAATRPIPDRPRGL